MSKTGYSWDCPNCGQHVTSFTLPPRLSSDSRNYLDLNSPDSERRLAAALAANLNVGWKPAHLERVGWSFKSVGPTIDVVVQARAILAALKEEVVNAEVVIANEADIVADINDRARHQNWPADEPHP